MEIGIIKSTSVKSALPKLDKVFSTFDITLKAESDNGSPFDCRGFDKYAKYLGFIHQPISPAFSHSIASGLVKNFNRMIDKVLRTANVEHQN